jgi:hypothetical protein
VGVAGGGAADVGDAGVEVDAVAADDGEVAALVGDVLLELGSRSRDKIWLWV